MNRSAARRTLALLLALTAVTAVGPLAAVDAAEANGKTHAKAKGKAKAKAKAKARARARALRSSNITVLTRNLFLGTDLIPIALAPSLDAFKQAASAGFAQVQATDFPTRAKLIAREVKRLKPDLIGLQEAALWRTGPEDGVANNATDVAYDFITLLRRELRRRGLRYGVARVTREADIEGPTADGFDVRLTIRDAILVDRRRRNLRVVGRGGDNYDNLLELQTQVGELTVTRGYAYADMVLRTVRRAKAKGRRRVKAHRFRFVDTHLEAFLEQFRSAQATELVGPGGPVAGKRTVILVGDVNSDPQGSQPAAWQIIEDSPLRDTWPWLYPNRPGYTCCTGPTLMDPPQPSPFDHRIDDVFAKGRVRPLAARVVGTSPGNSRAPSGLWASDHGGLATKLRLR